MTVLAIVSPLTVWHDSVVLGRVSPLTVWHDSVVLGRVSRLTVWDDSVVLGIVSLFPHLWDLGPLHDLSWAHSLLDRSNDLTSDAFNRLIITQFH